MKDKSTRDLELFAEEAPSLLTKKAARLYNAFRDDTYCETRRAFFDFHTNTQLCVGCYRRDSVRSADYTFVERHDMTVGDATTCLCRRCGVSVITTGIASRCAACIAELNSLVERPRV